MFANLRPMFANLRLSVVAIACLVAGRVLIVRHDSGLPSFETLEKMMGGFAWKTERQFTRSGEAEDPVSGARDHRRKYLLVSTIRRPTNLDSA